MACECKAMYCNRNICCGICEYKHTCKSVCKTCVPSNVATTTESDTNTHTEDSSDDD